MNYKWNYVIRGYDLVIKQYDKQFQLFIEGKDFASLYKYPDMIKKKHRPDAFAQPKKSALKDSTKQVHFKDNFHECDHPMPVTLNSSQQSSKRKNDSKKPNIQDSDFGESYNQKMIEKKMAEQIDLETLRELERQKEAYVEYEKNKKDKGKRFVVGKEVVPTPAKNQTFAKERQRLNEINGEKKLERQKKQLSDKAKPGQTFEFIDDNPNSGKKTKDSFSFETIEEKVKKPGFGQPQMEHKRQSGESHFEEFHFSKSKDQFNTFCAFTPNIGKPSQQPSQQDNKQNFASFDAFATNPAFSDFSNTEMNKSSANDYYKFGTFDMFQANSQSSNQKSSNFSNFDDFSNANNNQKQQTQKNTNFSDFDAFNKSNVQAPSQNHPKVDFDAFSSNYNKPTAQNNNTANFDMFATTEINNRLKSPSDPTKAFAVDFQNTNKSQSTGFFDTNFNNNSSEKNQMNNNSTQFSNFDAFTTNQIQNNNKNDNLSNKNTTEPISFAPTNVFQVPPTKLDNFQ